MCWVPPRKYQGRITKYELKISSTTDQNVSRTYFVKDRRSGDDIIFEDDFIDGNDFVLDTDLSIENDLVAGNDLVLERDRELENYFVFENDLVLENDPMSDVDESVNEMQRMCGRLKVNKLDPFEVTLRAWGDSFQPGLTGRANFEMSSSNRDGET